MRYLCSVAAFVTLGIFSPAVMFGQSPSADLTVGNYQLVSELRLSRSQWYATYSAKLSNAGPARSGVTATVTSLVSSIQVTPGQGVLHFRPVPANSQTPSSDTFTILVDRDVPFDFANLKWSFENPVADAGANQTATVGSVVNLSGSASSNPNNIGILSYSWSFVSRPAGSAATLTTAQAVLSSFVVDKPGNYVLKLTVSNGLIQDSANVTVSTVNSPPVAKSGPNQSAAVGASVTVNGSGSSDVDGDPLTYFWTLASRPAGSAAVIGNFRTVSANFTVDKPGAYVVQLVVNDGKVDSAPSTLTVTSGNTPPVANAGPTQVVSPGNLVQLNGSGSTDVDGDPLTYSWALITVPSNSNATLNNNTAVAPAFTADLAGTYVAQLIVNDGKIDSAAATVTVTTNAPSAPVANAGPNQTVAHGGTVALSGSGLDSQSRPLTYSWSLTTKPSGSVAVLSSLTIANPTFVADKPGVYVAQLIVNNGTVNSAPSTVTITTSNTPPVANAGSNQNVPSGASITLDGGNSSDADHDTLSYSWSFNSRPSGSNAALIGPATRQPVFVADLAGTYVVQLIVNDGFTNSAPATVTIVVASAQSISFAPPALSLNAGATQTLTLTLSGPAPSGGLPVTIVSNNTGVATVGSASATILANTTTVSISVTGVAAGTATIRASAANMPDAAATLTVSAPATGIVLLPQVTVAPGDTIAFPVSLSSPAPAALYVPLTSSDPSKVTLSAPGLNFNAGQTQPTRQPTIRGVAAGAATITATGPGLGTATSQVTVGLGVTMAPPSLTVRSNSDGTLTLTLSGIASSNLTFSLTSSNPAAATVPPTARISAGASVVSFKVAAVAQGSTVIKATAPGFVDVTSNVTVQPPGTITLSVSNTLVQIAQTIPVTVTLSEPAPANGLSVTLTSSDVSRAKLSASTVVIPQGSTTGAVQLTGVNVGSSTVNASAIGYTPAAPLVMQVGTVIAWVNPTATINGPGKQALLDLRMFVVVPGSNKFSVIDGVPITITSSNPSVAIADALVNFYWDGSSVPTTRVQVTSIGPGTTTLHAFGTNVPDVTMTLTVTGSAPVNTVGPAAITVVDGSSQVAAINTTFTNRLKALVKDSAGVPISNAIVTFAAPASGPSGTFAGGWNTGVTDVSGVATSSAFTANSSPGTYAVTASVGAVSTSFVLTNSDNTTVGINAVTPPLPLGPVSVTPAASNVTNQTFAFTFTNPTGASHLGVVNILINNALDGRAACYLAYVPSSLTAGTLLLVNDAGAAGGPFQVLTLPSSGSISNSQCSISGVGSSVTGSGNTLTLTLATALKTPFAGNKVVYMAARDDAGNNSGWQAMGVAKVPGSSPTGPSVANVAPGRTTAATETLTFNFSDTNGYADLAVLNILVNKSIDGRSACYLAYVPAGPTSGTLLLVNDAGAAGGPFQAMSIPGTGVIQNSQCTINGIGSSVNGAGNVLSLTLPFTFSQAFEGNRVIYAAARSNTVNSGWQSVGSAGITGAPATITVMGGTPQTTPINTQFANTFSIHVKDANNLPVSEATVTFNVPATGASGTFAGGVNTVVTDASGMATSAAFTANSKAGSYTVTANAGGASANFAMTNQTGPAASMAVGSGAPQSAMIGVAFSNRLVALVSDAGGNPVSGVTVSFAAPGIGATGSFLSGITTAVTDAAGLATSAVFTANSITGSYNVTATAGAFTTTFGLTNLAGPPATLEIISGSPQSAAITTAFAAPLSVRVKDGAGNLVTGATVTFTVPGSGASGAFAGGQNTAVTDATGTATSAIFTANTVAGAYTVTAGVASLTTGFSLSNLPGPPASIAAVSGAPQSAVINTNFTNVLTVVVKDIGNNPVSGATVTFNAPGTGASGSFAGGANTAVTDAAGLASSVQFTANSLAGPYSVVATVGALSTNFALANQSGPPASIAATAGTPQSAAIATVFATRFAVVVKDASNNPVNGATVTFSAPVSGASGSFAGNVVTATTDATGAATSAVFTANTIVGPYTVTASVGAFNISFAVTNLSGPPASIVVSEGSPQTTDINTPFANVLSVIVKDAGNNPIDGATVTFSAPGSGASGSFASNLNTAITDATGNATSVVFTANSIAGSYSVSASIGAVSTNFALTNHSGPAASLAVVSGSPQSAAVGVAFTNPLKVLVKDAGNNPVIGATVTFNAPGSGASGSFAGGQNTAITDATGTATSAIFTANNSTGAYSVTASVAALSTNFALTNLSGPPTSITATAGTPQSVAINTQFATQLSVVVKDASNNPVSGATVTFSAPGSGASGSFAGNVVTATTDATGTATSAVFTANSIAGSYNVTATVGALSTTLALTNQVGAPASIAVTSGSPQTADINTAFGSPLTVVVKDAGNNLISGATVTFAAPGSGASGSFAGAENTAITGAAGTATSVIFTSNSTVGSYNVTASIGALSANFSLTNHSGPPATIAVNGGASQSTAISSAFATRLSVIVKDAGNNPVSGATVTFAAPGSGASGSFAGNVVTATTDASGVATAAIFTANSSAGSYNVTATLGALSTTFALTNQPGAPAAITVTGGAGQTADINTAFASVFAVLVKDAGNNPVSGVTVTFAAPGGGASGAFAGSQNTAVTDANGVATSVVFTANSTAGNYNVVASTGAVNTNIGLTNHTGAPASITVSGGSPQSAAINTAFTTALSVLVKDAGNNPINGATITFAASASGAGGAFAGGQLTAVTNAAGIATSAQFISNSAVGTYNVTATLGALSTDFALTNLAGPAASIAVTSGSPQTAVINAAFGSPLVVVVKDAGNNPISGATVTFAAPGSGARGTFAGGQATAVTDATGTATSAVFTANSTAGSYTVTASIGALSTGFALTNETGPAASIAATSGSPQSAAVDTVFATPLTVVVKDAGNNPVSGATITFSAPASGASGVFAGGQTTATTDAAGSATSAVFTANSATGSYNVTATLGALSTTLALTNQAGPPASIAVVSGSGQNATISAAFTNPLKVIVKDAANNPVSGATVTFAAPGSGASGTFAGAQATAVTDATGTATSVAFTANSVAGSYTITATLGALSTGFTLTNQPGAAASVTMSAGSPQSSPINTAFATAFAVLVKDAGNNPVPGVTVTFTAPVGGATGSFTGGQTTAVTNAAGIATAAQFTASGVAGNYTVTAGVGALSANFSLTNQAGPAASITVTGGSPQSTAINTPFANALKVIVKDAGNNPVVGGVVTFAAPGSGASGSFASGLNTATTNATGTATSVVFTANGTLGSFNVTATIGALSTTFALTNQSGSPSSIVVTGGSPQSIAINTAFASPLSVIVKDSGNNPVIGATVTFAAPVSGASGSFAGSQNTAVTDATGTATSAIFTANSVAGTYSVTASLGALSTTFSLTNQAGPAASIAVSSGSPQSAAINVSFTNPLKAIVKDAGNNPVAGATVTFNAPGSGASGTFAGGQNTAITDATGTATSAQFTANNTTGGYTVTATLNALSTGFTLTNLAGAPASITATAGTPQSAAINSAFATTLTAQVKDGGNNPVVGATVTFAAPGSGASGTFAGGQLTAVTDATGTATSVVFTANSAIGTYNVTATINALSTNFALTNLTGPPASITVSSGSSQSAGVNAAFANPLKALVKDAGNNPVAGVTVTFTAPVSGASGAFLGGQNTAVTDASGIATSVQFTANTTLGTYSVAASVNALSTNFSLTNIVGAPATLAVVSGSGQTAVVSTGFTSPLKVLVKDVGNNPVSGVTVTFDVPGSGASGTFAGAQNTAVTDGTGVATSAQFFANATVGVYTVGATVPGTTQVNFSLTNSVGGGGAINVSNLTIGKNLQAPLPITLNPAAPAGGVTILVQSSDSNLALVGSGSSAGQPSVSIFVAEGLTTVSTTVQALSNSGSVTLTLSAPGYTNATPTVTLANSGFAVAGPNGVGAQISTYQGVSTPLTVYAGRLDGSGVFVVSQQVRGGLSVNVPVASSTPANGTVSASTVNFPGGSDTAPLTFNASTVNFGTTDVTATAPSGFTSPVGGATVNVNVQQSGIVPFTATIGQGLEKLANISLNGNASSNVTITLTSNDPAKLKFSTTGTGAGSTSINVFVPSGHTASSDFYVQSFGNSGTVGYTAMATGYGVVSGSITLANSGLQIQSPGGIGAASFQAQLDYGPANIVVFTGRVDAGGAFVETQPVVGGGSVSVNVVSSNQSVGTISSSPITITGGLSGGTTQFQPLALGSTTLTASAVQFSSAQVVANLIGGILVVPAELEIGKNLQDSATVILPTAAGSGGTPVTIQTSNGALLQLATTDIGAGSNSIVVTVPAGQNYATFFLHGLGNSGTVTYTATAAGIGPAIGTVHLVKSAIVMYPPTVSKSISTGSTALSVFSVTLDDTDYPNIFQAIAGGTSVVVPVASTNPSVGTVPASMTLTGGSYGGTLTVAFLHTGSTTINLTQPTGFSVPVALGSASITVTP